MKYLINNRQYNLLKEQEEQVLSFPFSMFNNDWNLAYSKIESLGNLESVGHTLSLYKSNIKSLGSLKSVGGDLDLAGSTIRFLGSLRSVGGSLYLQKTKIKSLGNLESVGGSLFLPYSEVRSLGNLKSVGGDLNLRDTLISKKYSEDQIRQMVDVKGEIYPYFYKKNILNI